MTESTEPLTRKGEPPMTTTAQPDLALMIDDLIEGALAERVRVGRNVPIHAYIGPDGNLMISTEPPHAPSHQMPHIARDIALAVMAAPVASAPHLRRDLYLAQRAMGDVTAARRGRLGQRLVRRAVMKRIGSSLFGKW